MTDPKDLSEQAESGVDSSLYLPPRREGLSLLRKVFFYHLMLAIFMISIPLVFPDFIDQLPIGGIKELEGSGDLRVTTVEENLKPAEDIPIVQTFIRTTSQFDSLGYARQLTIILMGVWLLMLPVSWVHKGIHKASTHDHSLDETTLVLPGIVAAIVLVVQHSLALAFSLAGIVAGVQFRRALQDTYDALFILVAIGTGLAAGVLALEIAAVLTVFFCYASLYVYYLGDGLESHHAAHLSALKKERKRLEKEAADKQQ
ncbi:MAG: hypothetical protein OES53_09240 [Xanthomonadales bacterium]|nr:hypothetical protein [Xanthomonadales bacterium]MDH3924565.1 hypothetical protein [Xanthomonadales bacterium]MDH4002254.1 hypothetical protein [Xanthomonadales bacterium]